MDTVDTATTLLPKERLAEARVLPLRSLGSRHDHSLGVRLTDTRDFSMACPYSPRPLVIVGHGRMLAITVGHTL